MKDTPSGSDYSHQETSDGHVVKGSYSVLLPDGRIETVNYQAGAGGYTADVTYSDGQSNSNAAAPASG